MNTKKIIVIGNAKTTIGKNLGKKIDAFDIVIRFNGCQIKGYEQDLGSKIDILSMIPTGKGANKLISEILVLPHVRKVKTYWFSRPRNLCGKEYSNILKIIGRNKNILHPTPELFTNIKNKCSNLYQEKQLPSTGMVTIEMALEAFPNNEIYITGFDFFKSGHYYSKLPIKLCHPVKAEKDIINTYISQNRLLEL